MTVNNTRMPSNLLVNRSLNSLQDVFKKLTDLQDQAGSLKRLRKPSDAPADVVPSLQLRAGIDRNDQLARNLDDASSWLGAADNALTAVSDSLVRVRDLIVMARNASSDAGARKGIADEIDNLRQGLISLANTQYAGRPVFGGTTSGGMAYTSNGSYVGISTAVERTIAPGQRVQVNVNGDDVFGTPGDDLFTTLAQVSAAVLTNPAGLDALATELDGRIQNVHSALGTVGARAKRVDDMKTQNTADGLTMKQNLSGIEDIDLADVMMKLEAQRVNYQAALQATAKAIQPSLADFLR
jgi:flagellar hook-associated protein 3 FlgL